MMKIAVIGTGYVGTVTGACMAELGHQVICADLNEHRIHQLQEGIVPLYEEGLESLIHSNVDEGRLKYTTDIGEAVSASDVIFLCVGANSPSAGKLDMKPLLKAIKDVAACLKKPGYKLIVEKSTLPVKTGDWLHERIKAELPEGAKGEYDIAAVPQFMREGNAIWDFMHPDRVIIGSDSQRAIDTLVDLYRPLSAPFLITDISSAELIKHASNAFLAMKISFINSMAHLCEKTGADITKVSKGLGMDKRIAPDYLNAGLGYGGIFFPKDIASLVNIADEYHVNLDLMKATEVVNRYQRINFIEKIEKAAKGDLHGKTVAIWGLAFRPNTDDMRDAPSLTVVRGLQKRGAKIRAFDPLAMKATKEHLPDITYCEDVYDAAKGADVIAILTEWDEFAHVNFRQLKKASDSRVIVDGRNLFSPDRMSALGYDYISMGRKPAKASANPTDVADVDEVTVAAKPKVKA